MNTLGIIYALIGVYILKEPNPKSRAAKLTLVGVVIAMVGAIVLGNIK